MDYPNTRAEAKRLGLSHYFTGQPCKRGHVALRKTKGCCVECIKEDWVEGNKRRATLPKSEASRAAGRRYYQKNRDLVKARANNRPKEDKRRYRGAWVQRNPDVGPVAVNARRRRFRQATPKWLTKEHKKQIRELYLAARKLTKSTGVKYVVDHIVPLRGRYCSGLHVPWNLTILTAEENLIKSNKHIEEDDAWTLKNPTKNPCGV